MTEIIIAFSDNYIAMTDAQCVDFWKKVKDAKCPVYTSNYLAVVSIQAAIARGELEHKDLVLRVRDKSIKFDRNGTLSEYPEEFNRYSNLFFDMVKPK